MTTASPPNLLPHLWKSTLASGVISVILGALILAWPGISVLTAALLLGVWLLLSGIAQVIFAFSLDVSAGGRILLFISGAASLILGLLAFRQLGEGDVEIVVLLLAIWVGVGFIFRGVATTVSAISDPLLPGRGWAIFFGVITLIAGMVVLASPLRSLSTLALVIGIWLVVVGVFETVSSFAIRKAGKKVAEVADRVAATQ